MRWFLMILLSASALWAQFGETIVVTAGAFPSPLEEVAPQATVLTAGELQARRIQNVDEAIRETLSAIVLRSGTPGKVSSLFLRGADSDHALILLNGVPVSNSSFSGYNYGDILTAGISRIEIVRGPYSALYGSEAMAGVVSLFTNGGTRDALHVSASAGGDGLAEGDASVDEGRLHLTLARHSEAGRLPNDGWAQSQGIFFYDAGAWGISLVGRDGDVGIPLNEGVPSPERRMRSQEYTMALPFHFDLMEGWKLEADAGTTWNRLRFTDGQDPYGYTWSDTRAGRAFARVLLEESGQDWKSAFGLEARRDTVSDRSVYGTNLDGKAMEDGALFFEETGAVGAMAVRAGLRLDHHSEFGSTLNPKLSLAVPIGKIRLHVQAGTAFRAPSMGELYFPNSGNGDLQPEKSVSVEAGVSGGGFTFNAFQSRYTNLIDFNYATYAFQNSGRSRIRGLEFQTGRTFGKTRLDLSATWLDTEDFSTGLPLLRRPRLSGSWFLTRPAGRFTVTASGLYVGRRSDIDAVTFARVGMRPFYRQDLTLAIEDPRLLHPYIKIENCFNSAYEEIAGYPALGRRVIAGLRWDMDLGKPAVSDQLSAVNRKTTY